MQRKQTLLLFFLLPLLFLCLHVSKIEAQFLVGTKASFVHYTHSGLGGASLGIVVEKSLGHRHAIQFQGGLNYAVGHRGFYKVDGEKYSLHDGAATNDYPFTAPHPGYDPEWYLFISKLKTGETIDIGFSILYQRNLIQGPSIKFNIGLGMNLAWIEDAYIPYSFKGDFKNVFITVEGLNMVAPFNDQYFTLGPIVEASLYFNLSEILNLGFHAGAVRLAKTGVKYSIGPSLMVSL